MQMIIIGHEFILSTRRELTPIFHVLVVVQVFAPLDEPIDILFKLRVVSLFKLTIIEWVVIKRFQLLLELG